MAYPLGDLFIGKAPTIQSFGARPDLYHARYNLKGHNGIDFGCLPLTPILAAADGWVLETGFDHSAYGNLVKIVHDGYLTTYGHLNDTTVKQNERVVTGQLIGHSNGTGLCDTPHLHFGVAPCDGSGGKTQKDNGYGGYIDPLSSLCEWKVKNLNEPIDPTTIEPNVSLSSAQYKLQSMQSANYIMLASFLISHGLNEYLASKQLPPVDLQNNPSDPQAVEIMLQFLTEKFNPPRAEDPSLPTKPYQNAVASPVASGKLTTIANKQDSFFFGLKKFIFTQP